MAKRAWVWTALGGVMLAVIGFGLMRLLVRTGPPETDCRQNARTCTVPVTITAGSPCIYQSGPVRVSSGTVVLTWEVPPPYRFAAVNGVTVATSNFVPASAPNPSPQRSAMSGKVFPGAVTGGVSFIIFDQSGNPPSCGPLSSEPQPFIRNS
jgi:hypothetical protein